MAMDTLKLHETNPKVDEFISNAKQWKDEFIKLRAIALECGLTEELKWGKPSYSFQSGNIVLIHGFKEYCALLFFKGSLLKDTHAMLISQTENVQAGRQIRFKNVSEISEKETKLKSYILQAIEVEKAGEKVVYTKSADIQYTEEFQNKIIKMPALKKAFDALTPGRQRAYHLYFCGAKQSKTRADRVEKCIPLILSGKGLNDVPVC